MRMHRRPRHRRGSGPILPGDGCGEQRVRDRIAFRWRHRECFEQGALAVGRGRATRPAFEDIDRTHPVEQGRDGAGVLGGEDLGGRHDGGLMARLDRRGHADTATSVFPEPTSPCRRTFIGRPRPSPPRLPRSHGSGPSWARRAGSRRAGRSALHPPDARSRFPPTRADACGARPRAPA